MNVLPFYIVALPNKCRQRVHVYRRW